MPVPSGRPRRRSSVLRERLRLPTWRLVNWSSSKLLSLLVVRSRPIPGRVFKLVLLKRAGADFGHHELTWLLEVRIGQEQPRRIAAFDFQLLATVPVGSRYAFQPVHRGKRRDIDSKNLPRDAPARAGTVDEPRHVAVPHQVQRIRGAGSEGASHPDSPICGEVGESFLQRAKDEYKVFHALRPSVCALRRRGHHTDIAPRRAASRRLPFL